jgi:inorganic pyrophosphatase
MLLAPETARCLLDGDPIVVALLLKEELVPGVGVEPTRPVKDKGF